MITTREKSYIELFLHIIIISITIFTLLHSLPTLIPFYRYTIIVMGSSILFANICFCVLRKNALLPLTRLVSIYFIVSILIVFVIYYISAFMVLTDTYGLEKVLRDYGSTAKWFYFFICFTQPIILPIPEVITIGAGSSVFGPVQAAALGFLGTLSGILVMYLVAKFGGVRIIHKFVKEKHLNQYHSYVSKHETLIMGLLFIIPILPDEIICIGAGISGVSIRRFVIIATLAKLITSVTLSYSIQLAGYLHLSTSEITIYIVLILFIVFTLSQVFNRLGKKEKAN